MARDVASQPFGTVGIGGAAHRAAVAGAIQESSAALTAAFVSGQALHAVPAGVAALRGLVASALRIYRAARARGLRRAGIWSRCLFNEAIVGDTAGGSEPRAQETTQDGAKRAAAARRSGHHPIAYNTEATPPATKQ